MKNNRMDIFAGKIKREHISGMWATMILVLLLGVGVGIICVYLGILTLAEGSILGVVYGLFYLLLGVIFILFGVGLPALMVFVIRTYPNHTKLRQQILKSDYYFVGNDNRTTHVKGNSRLARTSRNSFFLHIYLEYLLEEKKRKKHLQKNAKAAAGQIEAFLRTVPPGKVVTYAQVAEAVGRSTGVVYTYLSVAENESAPVHKIVGLEGDLMEKYPFGGIIGQKRRLNAERIEVQNSKVNLGRYKYRT